MQLSVIILNYNVRYFLEQCLASVQEALIGINSEIIVVDNLSTDDSCDMIKSRFPNIKLIENDSNLGFPKGNNIGVASANGDIYTSVDYGATWTEINGVGTAPNYWYSSAISGDGKFLFLGESSYGSGDFIYKIAIPGA